MYRYGLMIDIKSVIHSSDFYIKSNILYLYNELLFIPSTVCVLPRRSDGYYIAKRTTAIRIADQGATILYQGVTTIS